jgi:hypothetical protein
VERLKKGKAEIAAEIFADVDKYFVPNRPPFLVLNAFDWVAIKEKYTEGEKES